MEKSCWVLCKNELSLLWHGRWGLQIRFTASKHRHRMPIPPAIGIRFVSLQRCLPSFLWESSFFLSDWIWQSATFLTPSLLISDEKRKSSAFLFSSWGSQLGMNSLFEEEFVERDPSGRYLRVWYDIIATCIPHFCFRIQFDETIVSWWC